MTETMDSYKYIAKNFLTRTQLLKISSVSGEKLSELISAGCFPNPSYRVELGAKIESFFGEHSETEVIEFFPKSAAQLLANLANLANLAAAASGAVEMAVVLKEEFCKEYQATLLDLEAASYGLWSFFEADGASLNAEGAAFLNQEWQHYLDGTYGVCTNTADVRDIATKEAMIARIKFICAEIDAGRKGDLLDRLVEAVDQLDSVSAAFAPHELERSSREKFINQIRLNYL